MQFKFPQIHPTPLGTRRVALPPHCDAIEVHLLTQVLRRALSPRKGSPQTLESDAATFLRLTRVAMSNDPPHTTPKTLSVPQLTEAKRQRHFRFGES
ncbi:hypothetical protein E2C01_044169 [Portunus trituberculatus]|uniref:Uncharacterized protein n=1 Tax=Portunus trituberculatus TaxID=210409 RepID=A0A5B7FSF3_PORTR|nr:hypothetical protein [Portunus trituberculatus]